jgi:hypothetical protein
VRYSSTGDRIIAADSAGHVYTIASDFSVNKRKAHSTPVSDIAFDRTDNAVSPFTHASAQARMWMFVYWVCSLRAAVTMGKFAFGILQRWNRARRSTHDQIPKSVLSGLHHAPSLPTSQCPIRPKNTCSLFRRFHPNGLLFTLELARREPSKLATWRVAYSDEKSKDNAQAALVKRVKVHNEAATVMEISSDGRYVAVGMASGHVVVLDARSLSTVCAYRLHSFIVTGVAFSADCNSIVSVSADRTVRCTKISQQRRVPWVWLLLFIVLVIALYWRAWTRKLKKKNTSKIVGPVRNSHKVACGVAFLLMSESSSEEDYSQATVNKALKTRLAIDQHYQRLFEEMKDREERLAFFAASPLSLKRRINSNRDANETDAFRLRHGWKSIKQTAKKRRDFEQTWIIKRLSTYAQDVKRCNLRISFRAKSSDVAHSARFLEHLSPCLLRFYYFRFSSRCLRCVRCAVRTWPAVACVLYCVRCD